jgi:hypothetical protein
MAGTGIGMQAVQQAQSHGMEHALKLSLVAAI